jgi:hypothetical protein
MTRLIFYQCIKIERLDLFFILVIIFIALAVASLIFILQYGVVKEIVTLEDYGNVMNNTLENQK